MPGPKQPDAPVTRRSFFWVHAATLTAIAGAIAAGGVAWGELRSQVNELDNRTQLIWEITGQLHTSNQALERLEERSKQQEYMLRLLMSRSSPQRPSNQFPGQTGRSQDNDDPQP